MTTWKKLGLGLAVCGLGAMSQGCASLAQVDQLKQENEALRHAYSGADTMVGNYKKRFADLETKNQELERQLMAARGQVQDAHTKVTAASSAIAEERSRMQTEYEKMLAELKRENFVINDATGGIVLENDIFFSPGNAKLKTETNAQLDKLIEKLSDPKFAGAKIEIAGHTDADPITRSGWEDNYQLSAERARAVLVYFGKRGLSEERMFLSGYGKTQPRSEEKSENRRVEIVLQEKT